MDINEIGAQLTKLQQQVSNVEKQQNIVQAQSSLEIDQLAAALCKAQAEYPVLGKNRHGHFTYADKNSLKRAVDPILLKHGLSVTAGLRVAHKQEYFFMKLMHSSGQYQISECVFDVETTGKRSKEQERGSTISYLSRYMYRELLGITIDEDPDDDDDHSRAAHQPKLTEEQIEQLSKLPTKTQQSILDFNKVSQLQDLTQRQYNAFKERYYKKQTNM